MENVWTEKQLKELNEFAYEMNERIISIGDTKSIGGVEVQVIDAIQGLEGEGYNGLAVAPIINGEPDLSQIAIVSKGTNVGLNLETGNALNGKTDITGSRQAIIADEFVVRVQAVEGHTVVKLTGHSQGSYMIKIGAKYQIPTTVFNGWVKYRTLTKKEAEFVKNNPHFFVNYRKKDDWLVWWNDGNKVDDEKHFGTIVWIDGDSHNLEDWVFDANGHLISSGTGSENFNIKLKQTKNDGAIALFQLSLLKGDFQQTGPITKNQQIFLDDSAALIVMQTMYNTLNIYLENAMLFYQNANGQLPDVWNDGVSAALNAMDNLEYAEVLGALFDGGASTATVIENYEQIFAEKLRRISEVQEKFERVIATITKSIEEFVDADERLSLQLNG